VNAPLCRRAFGALVLCALSIAPACGARVDAHADTAPPALQTTLALILAGGGASDFKSTTLIGVLAGPNANEEVAKLTKRHGAALVKAYIGTFDFVVADGLRLMKQRDFTLPAAPALDPKDGKALAAALYAAGLDPSTQTFSVDNLLDRLVSRRLRVELMKDVTVRYGRKAAASYHSVTLEVVHDLRTA
jgi:hypothetical protein